MNLIRIYNTLTRKKEIFESIEKNKVLMYVCGPTVYDYLHIGNARPYVVFDTVRRYLEYLGYEVKYVQNFTDIDDKIINRANNENKNYDEIAEKFIDEALPFGSDPPAGTFEEIPFVGSVRELETAEYQDHQ